METNGSGSIIQLEKDKPKSKCRKWRLFVSIGIDPKTGKYIPKTRRFTGTYTEAKKALREFVDDLSKQKRNPKKKLTFEELADEYVSHKEQMREITHETASKNRYSLNSMKHHIGKLDISKIEPYMIEDAFKGLLSGDSVSGKPLAGTTVNGVARVTSAAFKYALKCGYLSSNPCDDVDTPSVDTKEKSALTNEQVSFFVSNYKPCNRYYAALYLALFGGLRLGECIRANWGDVNLVEGFMHVRGTKNAASNAVVPIREELVKALLTWKEIQQAKLSKNRLSQTDETPILGNALGERPKPHTIDTWWRRNRDSLGFGDIKFHQLRHTFITLLARDNIHPSVMQKLARHADDRTTMKIYTHVNLEQEMEAIKSLSKFGSF